MADTTKKKAALMRATESLRQALAGATQAGRMDEKALRNLERIAQDIIRGWRTLDPEPAALKARLGGLVQDLFAAAELAGVAPGRAVLDGALLISALPQAGRES